MIYNSCQENCVCVCEGVLARALRERLGLAVGRRQQKGRSPPPAPAPPFLLAGGFSFLAPPPLCPKPRFSAREWGVGPLHTSCCAAGLPNPSGWRCIARPPQLGAHGTPTSFAPPTGRDGPLLSADMLQRTQALEQRAPLSYTRMPERPQSRTD